MNKLNNKCKDQRGSLNISGLMMMGVGMIFLAVGFIIYPIILDACDGIYAWVDPTTMALTYEDFTGLGAVVGILPLIVLLGFVTAGAITGFMGVKMLKGGASGSLQPSSLMMLGLGIIFIAVALIIFPVIMDGVATALEAEDAAVGDFTGLTAILYVTPLIVLTAFMAGGIVAGFFGIKGASKAITS